uniref:Uncharacterized protein n=1 Tax=Romanomermis culicivorax TaxID=13658 RepID=A0A915JT75_ROMCU
MGIVPISLINLLKNAGGIIGFTANCDLTAMANEGQVPTSSSNSTKRNWEEKPSAKSSKPQPKKPKVGAALNPNQTRDTRAVEENRRFVQIVFETRNIFKPKPPLPDCNFSAFNYFHHRFVTPITNQSDIEFGFEFSIKTLKTVL